LIANPPYIPAPDDRIYLPALHGGVDGATLTNRLLSLGCETVMLLISAYSNPVETIRHAIDLGYRVTDFMITPLQFGYYSSEPKVRDWITELRKQNKAFYSANIYFLSGVLFQKTSSAVDLSAELLKVITTL
jgi:methylase of polypeptide subunit release factors